MSRRAGRFTPWDPTHPPQPPSAIFRWGVLDRLTGRRRVAPPGPPAPRVEPDLDLVRERGGPPRLTWIGHASFLGTLGGASFLVDPNFSGRIGWYRRHGSPGLRVGDLPEVAAVLVSHNHYDHLDARSIAALPRDLRVAAPLGLGDFFRRRGFTDVHELDWWDELQAGPLTITAVPARHWTRRGVFDTNAVLWCGFVVRGGGVAVYHAGDSAAFPGFAEVGRRFPGLAAAMLPIGSYRPAWFMEHHHMNPEQAGEAFLETGADVLVPMHWGAYQLTDEPISEPRDRLVAWWRGAGLPERRLRVLAVGETLRLG